MKKIINENTIKSIVRESLKNYLKESMDINSSEGWTPEMDDMWDEFGNNNVHDTDANMLRGYEQYSIPSESTFQKVYDLYHYLDGGAYKESDATRELRDMISGWLNKQSQGEMNSAIGG